MARWNPPLRPPSWRLGPPDYVGVGALKAGTTWWARLIAAHPTVRRHPGLPKELHFFDPLWSSSCPPTEMASAYHRFFPRPPGTVTGEWTPNYMHLYWVPSLLAMAAPAAKILVLLRDPTERFRSELTMAIQKGRAQILEAGSPHPATRLHRVGAPRGQPPAAEGPGSPGRYPSPTPYHLIPNKLTDINRIFNNGFYFGQLTRLFTFFPREQVLVLQFERCVLDPAGELERTYRFIGIDPGFFPPSLDRPVNRTKEEKIRLSSRQDRELREGYRDEVRRLSELVPEIDMSLWSQY